MQPWNDWYHVNGNTYGSWLPGDPRGWRTRHHRRHVEGDYKRPPPAGTGDRLLVKAKQLMSRDPVVLTPAEAKLASESFAATFAEHQIQAIAIAVDDHHFHVLLRCPDHNPRKWIGLAKKESSWRLTTSGMTAQGGVWSVRSMCKPIRDRQHQLAVFRYIESHGQRGSAVWTALHS